MQVHHRTTRREFMTAGAGGATALLLGQSSCTESPPGDWAGPMDVDWQAYMAKHDLVWDSELPHQWQDGPFMGNGLLGTVIFVSPDNKSVCFQVGNSKVEDHRHSSETVEVAFMRERMPIGEFRLNTVGTVTGGRMRLHLRDAVTEAELTTDKGELRFRCYVHADTLAVIVEMEMTGEEEAASWEFIPQEAISPKQHLATKYKEHRWIKKDYVPNPPYELSTDGDITLCFQEYLEGGETATAGKEVRTDGQQYFAFTCAHTYPEKGAVDVAKRQLAEAEEAGPEKLRETHLDWWHTFYSKSFVSIPDAKLESYYWIQMYKLASATRADRPVIDDSGPWHEDNVWAYLTWNLNVQMAYWPIYPSNRLDVGLSLVNRLYEERETLRNNVRPKYREDSYALPINSGSDLVGLAGHPGFNGHRGLMSALPWTVHNMWLHYRHSMDDELLREKIFPLLRGAIAYYFHFLEKGDDGFYHLPKTNSPEFGNTRDANIDLGLIRWGCAALLESCERLGIDDPMIPRWRDVIENLAPYTIHEHGMGIGPDSTLDRSHRHFSHLLPIYPLYLVNAEQEGGWELIRKSLEFWLSRKEPEGLYRYVNKRSKAGRFHGYTYTAASSFYATIGDGDTALEYVEKAFDLFPHCFVANGLYLEWGVHVLGDGTLRSYAPSGPTTETALCVAQNIHDMLIQSWGGKVRVFPAVPAKWQDVCFSHLTAEGGFLVSAKRVKGETVFVRVESRSGEPLVLKPGISGEPRFRSSAGAEVKELAAGKYRIDLKAGEWIEATAGEGADRRISPVATFGPANFWGEQAMQRPLEY